MKPNPQPLRITDPRAFLVPDPPEPKRREPEPEPRVWNGLVRVEGVQ